MRGDRLFRREFMPVAAPGEYVIMRGDGTNELVVESGNSPLWQVSHAESSGDGLAIKGVDVIYCFTSAPDSPYVMDVNAQAAPYVGTALASGSSLSLFPKWATLQKRQIAQVRMIGPVAVPDSGGNNVQPQDFFITVNAPAAAQRFGNAFLRGGLTPIMQFPLPGSKEPYPPAGSPIATPTNFPVDPFDAAYKSQVFLWGVDDQQLQLTLTNYGATTTQGAVGVQFGVYFINLVPVPLGSDPQSVWIFGHTYQIPRGINPNDIVPIPVGSQNTPCQTG